METVIVSAMPFLCGRLPPVAVNILSKHFSISSDFDDTWCCLKKFTLSLNLLKLEDAVLFSELSALQQCMHNSCFWTIFAT